MQKIGLFISFDCYYFTDSLKKVCSTAQILPGPDDVEGLVMALLRLQDIYRLHPTNISVFSGGCNFSDKYLTDDCCQNCSFE